MNNFTDYDFTWLKIELIEYKILFGFVMHHFNLNISIQQNDDKRD